MHGGWCLFGCLPWPNIHAREMVALGTCQSHEMLTIRKDLMAVNGLQRHIFLTTLLVAWSLVLTFGSPLVDIPCSGLGFESPLANQQVGVAHNLCNRFSLHSLPVCRDPCTCPAGCGLVTVKTPSP